VIGAGNRNWISEGEKRIGLPAAGRIQTRAASSSSTNAAPISIGPATRAKFAARRPPKTRVPKNRKVGDVGDSDTDPTRYRGCLSRASRTRMRFLICQNVSDASVEIIRIPGP
jgi:hypothetical protein